MNLKNIYANRQTVPGAALGVENMGQVHDFNLKQLRRRGFFTRTVVGQNNINIQLSGTAKLLCGILVFDDSGDPRNVLSLTINNDTRIEQVSNSSLTRIFVNGTPGPATFGVGPYCEEYFPVPALLSGNDSITVEYNAITGSNLYLTFYYI